MGDESPDDASTGQSPRVTFNATPRALAALHTLTTATGDNRTDVINTQLRLAAILLPMTHPDGGLRIVDPNGELRILHLI
ncbi:hypothetical protein AB0B31_11085 [Catellatospora citrea]|uniref:hypothetical protein n=1 Tax=Catellatospora citrea TaxID=53366 RepID=UPI0033DF649B